MTTLPPIPSVPRAPQARIPFPLILALALIMALSVCITSPASAEAVEPLIVSVSLNKTTIAVGETVSATWTISGGRAPYSILYNWYITSSGSEISKAVGYTPSGVTVSSFSPTLGESCYVFASIKDTDGRTQNIFSKSIPVTGSTTVEPLTVSVSLDKTTVAVGETVTATWTISGGCAPYSILYNWYITSSGSEISKAVGYTPSGVTASSFSPTLGESCYVFASIKDADGRTQNIFSKSIPVTGSTTVEPLTVSVSLDKTAVAVGETVTAKWTISGGRAPYSILYNWYITSSGSEISKEVGYTPSGVTVSNFSPTLGESCYVFASIKDADGRTQNIFSQTIPVNRIYATGIALNTSSTMLDIGSEKHLTATVSPSNCSTKTVSWSSNYPSVASVDSSGLVKAVGEGKADITASTVDGSGLSAVCKVTVNPPIPVASVSISGPSGPLAVGAKYRLTASVLPDNATYKGITWTTDKPGIATVQDGLVTGVAKGSAVITATAPSGAKADWNVTVSSTASRLRAFSYGMGMQFSYNTSIIFKVGAQYGTPPYTADVTLSRDGTALYTTSYSMNSSKDVSVPVSSIPAGTYTATAVVTDAMGRVDTASTTCYMYAYGWNVGVSLYNEVRPITAITGIGFESESPSVAIGQTLTLSPFVSPSGAATPNYEWISSNPTAVTISDTGVASAVAKGTSVITASATDGSGLSASCTVTAYRAASSVSLNQSQIKLTQGGKATLAATVLPADANYKNVTWESSDPSIATVSGGVVTGVRDGTAVITATAHNGVRATCDVTVSNRIESIELTQFKDLPLVNGAYELNLKDTLQLTPQTVPENVGASFAYTSSNSKVVYVSKLGLIQALKAGTCTITISARNTSASTPVTKALKLRVIVPVSSVRTESGFTIFAGTSRKLKASVSPDSATYQTLRWSSGNQNVATVDPATGNVYGVSPGTADITATAHNGVYFTRQIRVTRPVGSITLTAPVKAIYAGKTVQITPTVLPDDADESLKWTSSSSKVATVNQTGLVTGKGPGTVWITASAMDGSKKSGSLTLKVVKPASSISMKKTMTLYTNGNASAKLSLTSSPSKSGYLSVEWTSDDPAVASVDKNGTVMAHADGTTTIRATTDPGLGKTAECSVTVLTYPSYIRFALLDRATLKVGDKLHLIPPLVELNGSVKNLAWKSFNTRLATIDKKGVLTAKKPGRVKIRVTTANRLYSEAWLNIVR